MNSIGKVFDDQERFKEALEYYTKALNIYLIVKEKESLDYTDYADTAYRIGLIHKKMDSLVPVEPSLYSKSKKIKKSRRWSINQSIIYFIYMTYFIYHFIFFILVFMWEFCPYFWTQHKHILNQCILKILKLDPNRQIQNF